MHKLRFIDSGAAAAAFNMGLDEAILESVSAGAMPPTLRFYSWEPRAVSIGYFQDMDEEIDLAACADRGIDAVRRVTGGGAVFHDRELTYSVILPESHPLSVKDIMGSYRFLCSGLTEGFSGLGIKAEFAPLNDIVSGGRKVSGNAQTRKKGCLLQHGTILLDLDLDTMFAILRIPQEKLKGKLVAEAKQRVTSAREILGRPVSYEESAIAFKAGFEKALDAGFDEEDATAAEKESALRLAAGKYSNPGWNANRQCTQA